MREADSSFAGEVNPTGIHDAVDTAHAGDRGGFCARHAQSQCFTLTTVVPSFPIFNLQSSIFNLTFQDHFSFIVPAGSGRMIM